MNERQRIIDTYPFRFNPKYKKELGVDGILYRICLGGFAEDWGGYEPDYAVLSAQMGTLGLTETRIEVITGKLIEMGEVIPYEIDGVTYHWVADQLKQGVKRPQAPKLPLPSWITCQAGEWKSGKGYATYKLSEEKLKQIGVKGVTPLITSPPTPPAVQPTQVKQQPGIVKGVVDYLNEKTGKKFTYTSDETIKLVKARQAQGFKLEDFKTVIDVKVAEWAGDPNYSKFLQPSTLFGNKFEGYLNQRPVKAPVKKTQLCKVCKNAPAFTNDGKCTTCNAK